MFDEPDDQSILIAEGPSSFPLMAEILIMFAISASARLVVPVLPQKNPSVPESQNKSVFYELPSSALYTRATADSSCSGVKRSDC